MQCVMLPAMCFVLLALGQHPDFPLILASNRDEYFHRSALPVHNWEDYPTIIAGKDVESGGSWLALNQYDKRLALITNYRSGLPQSGERSRGLIVRDMVTHSDGITIGLQQLQNQQYAYAGFNLLTGYLTDKFYYFSNRNTLGVLPLQPGLYALSNAFLDTPWPKAQRGKNCLKTLMKLPHDLLIEALLTLLADTTPAAEAELPDTGIGLEKEKWLSSIFIVGEVYGTRCSSVILRDKQGQITFLERTYNHRRQIIRDVVLSI